MQERLREQANVPFPVTKRRQGHLDHGQPIVKVFSKPSVGHSLFEIGVGRGNDARIHLDLLTAADPFNALFLQKSKQFHLQR